MQTESKNLIEEFSSLIKAGFGLIYEEDISKYWFLYFKEEVLKEDLEEIKVFLNNKNQLLKNEKNA